MSEQDEYEEFLEFKRAQSKRKQPASPVDNLISEAKERGCDTEAMFTRYTWAGGYDEGFLRRKSKERKKFPDIAARWDSHCGGKDQNAEFWEDHDNPIGRMIGYILIVITFIIFIAPVIAKTSGLTDKATLGFSGYEPPKHKTETPQKFYDDLNLNQ